MHPPLAFCATGVGDDAHPGLDDKPFCYIFVLMEADTLGVARSLGQKVRMRCANGYRESTKSMRRCVYRKQLDLETLVCTRGPNFALSRHPNLTSASRSGGALPSGRALA
jgi:hypothetical protein